MDRLPGQGIPVRLFEDHLFATLTAVGTSLLVFGLIDIVWRRWRESHPPRKPPSRKDWRRIRAVEQRVRAAQLIARLHAEAEAEAEASAAHDVQCEPCPRSALTITQRTITDVRASIPAARLPIDSAVRRPVPLASAPAGWVHAFSGSLL